MIRRARRPFNTIRSDGITDADRRRLQFATDVHRLRAGGQHQELPDGPVALRDLMVIVLARLLSRRPA